MKKLLSLLALALPLLLQAQTISYKGEQVELGPHAYLVDANSTLDSPFVFRTFNEAAAALHDGTAAEPMRMFIAPWVYWIDDPDDPGVRTPAPGAGSPIGLTVRCNKLQLLGLSEDAQDVVLASARGQSQGARGNFTMFDFYGDDLTVKDLTMGNYCNIDLVYPRNPSLNRPRRGPAITQAQLAFTHGDRIYAENVRFMARLNLCPLNGPGRALYVNCHFECTDDSLNGSGVYVGCSVDFYGRQPFGSVNRYGSVWMDCDFNVCHSEDVQAISKGVGRHTLVDVRYHGPEGVALSWTFRPEEWLRCYQYNVSYNGKPAFVGAAKQYNTVPMDLTGILSAYRLTREDGSVLYNTYNLVRGDDDWDPQGIRDEVLALGEGSIPKCLDLSVREAFLQTGGEPLEIKAVLTRQNGTPLNVQTVKWKVQPGFEKYIKLSSGQGYDITATPCNTEDETKVFDLLAFTEEGLQAAVKLTVSPDFVTPPSLQGTPAISLDGTTARAHYTLDLQGRRDESLVTWYRCDGKDGSGAVPVAVSRGGKPKLEYTLQSGDDGKYLAVGVAPKHLRCEAGREILSVYPRKIKVPAAMRLETDFSDFPADNQTAVRPGYWTVDAFKPADTRDYDWSVDPSLPCWTYGYGINGASRNPGLQQLQQGARLRYTPPKGRYGDMSVTWRVDPAKDGGQGFASARMQYLDCFVKFDTGSLSGYALRVIRTTKYANAVDVLLVRYDNGSASAITEPITVDCFLTGCTLKVWTSDGTLNARVEGPGRVSDLASDPHVKHSADLRAPVEMNTYGGFGLQHTSTVGTESRISVISAQAEWK